MPLVDDEADDDASTGLRRGLETLADATSAKDGLGGEVSRRKNGLTQECQNEHDRGRRTIGHRELPGSANVRVHNGTYCLTPILPTLFRRAGASKPAKQRHAIKRTLSTGDELTGM
jgi:hypothetical protein